MPRKAPAVALPTADLTTTLELLPLADLRPHPRNDGTHPPDEIAHLKASIATHGVYRNVVVAQDGTILAGRGVTLAAAELGMTHIAGQRMPYGQDNPRALQLLVGDNHIARLRQQDDVALVELLQDLQGHDPLALLGTGFDEAALAALAEAQGLGNGTGTDEAGRDVEPQINRAEELREQWGVEAGQLWACGEHRIICGDCTDKVVVERLMEGVSPHMLLNDPPYGMSLETDWTATTGRTNRYTHLTGRPQMLHAYPPIHGDDAPFDRRRVPLEAAEEFWFGADYYVDTLPACGKEGSWLVWDKRQEGPVDTMWGSAFELCWSKRPHRRELIRIVWAGILGHNKQHDGGEKYHPTQKPVALYQWLLERFSDTGARVFDGFIGSGSTLLACENLARTCYGAEISSSYTAVTLQRYADLTHDQPTRLA